jgi:twitching motility protein PilT
MAEFIRDEALDALVQELNRKATEAPRGAHEGSEESGAALLGGRREVAEGEPLERLLSRATAHRATDVLLIPDSPPVLRVAGRLHTLDAPALDEEEISSLFAEQLTEAGARRLQQRGGLDFSLRLLGTAVDAGVARAWRFRVNLHRQRGRLAAAIRALPREVPSLAALNLPAALAELVKPTRGLVLVCGPTGAGKTSTLAALVGEINRTRTCHIVTVEDPIEYEHPNQLSIVEQIEVGSDTPSFAAALRAALRQNPDVLLVGEMRDLASIRIVLTAAETGHLVLSTLHTNDVAQAVHRIVDVFSGAQQGQIRQQLALAVHAVVCQQLVPRADGSGRVPAVEVLLATNAVRHHIRKQSMQSLYNEIVLGKRAGMITLEASLAGLVKAGAISRAEAEIRASHPEELESLLRG